jgi:hypothetical protein
LVQAVTLQLPPVSVFGESLDFGGKNVAVGFLNEIGSSSVCPIVGVVKDRLACKPLVILISSFAPSWQKEPERFGINPKPPLSLELKYLRKKDERPQRLSRLNS